VEKQNKDIAIVLTTFFYLTRFFSFCFDDFFIIQTGKRDPLGIFRPSGRKTSLLARFPVWSKVTTNFFNR